MLRADQRALRNPIGNFAEGAIMASAANFLRNKMNQKSSATALKSMKKQRGVPSGIINVTAPRAMGAVQSGPMFSFYSAKNGKYSGIGINGSQYFCEVYQDLTAGTSPVLLPWGATAATGNNVPGIKIDIDNEDLMPPPLTNLSQCFGRFLVKRLGFEYIPAIGTETSGQVALAFATDPQTTQSGVSLADVSEFTNSVTFPPWQGAKLEVPVDNELRYLRNTTTQSAMTAAEWRQDSPGVLLGAGAFLAGSGYNLWGTIRIFYTIELYEVMPQTVESSLRTSCPTCRVPLVVTKHRKRGQHRIQCISSNSLEEKKMQGPSDDFQLVSMTPTAVLPDREVGGRVSESIETSVRGTATIFGRKIIDGSLQPTRLVGPGRT
jgi:hypothetical protein